jgi:hypothetical protein
MKGELGFQADGRRSTGSAAGLWEPISANTASALKAKR